MFCVVKYYTYTTKNRLDYFYKQKMQEKIREKGVERVLIKEITQELADYCGVTFWAIEMIRRHTNQPSLALALKIAEYFGVKVEDIFEIVEQDVLKEEIEKNKRKYRKRKVKLTLNESDNLIK